VQNLLTRCDAVNSKKKLSQYRFIKAHPIVVINHQQ
jgi:hypothetical protein